MASPIETSVISTGVGVLIGRIVSRSETIPTTMTAASAARQANTSGAFQVATNAAVIIPPIMTHSPWAKLMASVALKITLKPTATSA